MYKTILDNENFVDSIESMIDSLVGSTVNDRREVIAQWVYETCINRSMLTMAVQGMVNVVVDNGQLSFTLPTHQ